MVRADGRKLVAFATTGMVAVVSVGTIYLPFMADRDKLRGLNEEDVMPEGARSEMEKVAKEQQKVAKEQQQISEMKETKIPGRSSPNGGSMWKNFGRGGGNK